MVELRVIHVQVPAIQRECSCRERSVFGSTRILPRPGAGHNSVTFPGRNVGARKYIFTVPSCACVVGASRLSEVGTATGGRGHLARVGLRCLFGRGAACCDRAVPKTAATLAQSPRGGIEQARPLHFKLISCLNFVVCPRNLSASFHGQLLAVPADAEEVKIFRFCPSLNRGKPVPDSATSPSTTPARAKTNRRGRRK